MNQMFIHIKEKIYNWHNRDRSQMIKEEFSNRWEPLFIETRFDDLEECRLALIATTSGSSRSGYFKDGIIGDVYDDGVFELTLNLPRSNRCRYIGGMQEINGKFCLIGNIKPKKRVAVIWSILFPIYSLWVIWVSFNGYTLASGYSIFYYVFSIFVFFMIFPMILDALLKMDCRRTAKLMGENIYAQLK